MMSSEEAVLQLRKVQQSASQMLNPASQGETSPAFEPSPQQQLNQSVQKIHELRKNDYILHNQVQQMQKDMDVRKQDILQNKGKMAQKSALTKSVKNRYQRDPAHQQSRVEFDDGINLNQMSRQSNQTPQIRDVEIQIVDEPPSGTASQDTSDIAIGQIGQPNPNLSKSTANIRIQGEAQIQFYEPGARELQPWPGTEVTDSSQKRQSSSSKKNKVPPLRLVGKNNFFIHDRKKPGLAKKKSVPKMGPSRAKSSQVSGNFQESSAMEDLRFVNVPSNEDYADYKTDKQFSRPHTSSSQAQFAKIPMMRAKSQSRSRQNLTNLQVSQSTNALPQIKQGQPDYSHVPDINLDLLNLDNLDESLEMIKKCDPDFQFNSSQNTTQDLINLNLAASQLFSLNRNNTQSIKSVQKLIKEHDMDNINQIGIQNGNTQHAQRGISELLRQNLKMNGISSATKKPRYQMVQSVQNSANGLPRRNTDVYSSSSTHKISRVYQQNLGKLAEIKRDMYNKTYQTEMNMLPPEKNFVKQNKIKASQQLDRLKKLKQVTQQQPRPQVVPNQSVGNFLQESIENHVQNNNQDVQSFDRTQNSFNIDVVNNMIDDASDKTFEQFQNLKMIAGEKNVSRRKKGNTIFQGLTNSKMNLSGSGGSKSRSRSRSRSPPYNNKDNYGMANTPAPMKNNSPKHYNLAGTKIIPKRVRSQTATGAGRTQAIPSRKFFQRKQQSAVRKSNDQLTQNRSAAGRLFPFNNNDGGQSSLTTNKLVEFGQGQKSVQAFGNVNLNLDDNVKSHSNLRNESLPDISERRKSSQMPSQLMQTSKRQTRRTSPNEQNDSLKLSVGTSKSPKQKIIRGQTSNDFQERFSQEDDSFSNQVAKHNNLLNSYDDKQSSIMRSGQGVIQKGTKKPLMSHTNHDYNSANLSTSQNKSKTRPPRVAAAPNIPLKESADNLMLKPQTASQASTPFNNQTARSKQSQLSKGSINYMLKQGSEGFIHRKKDSPFYGNKKFGQTQDESMDQKMSNQVNKSKRNDQTRSRSGERFMRTQASQRSTSRKSVIKPKLKMNEPQPIYDNDGNVIYLPKHRKPKWVLQSEYDRFMKFEDCAMAGENSRNNRIRMEDPFSREPENTKVFTHIRDIEVAKYIMGSSYLEKDELDEFTQIGIHKRLSTFKLFMQELVIDSVGRYQEQCSDLCRQAIEQLEYEFKIFGVKDPDTDLKADPNFVVNYKINETHLDFRESYMQRILSEDDRALKEMLFMDVFAEDTKEWKMKFDPYTTLKKLARYKMPIPEFFEETHEEIKQWHKIIDRRAFFGTYLFKPEGSHSHDNHCKGGDDNFEPGLMTDTGCEVISVVKARWDFYRKDYLEEKRLIKIKKNQEDLDLVLEELRTSKDLVMPELPYVPLDQLTMDEFTDKYYNYFSHNPETDTRGQLQQKISKELLRLRPVMATYDLLDLSSFGSASDQSDYMRRIRFQDALLLSEKYDLVKIINDEVYRTKQRKKMISRLSPFDQSVLYEKGIEIPFRPFDTHPDLQPFFFKHNFSFEKQDLFYYQWYADFQRNAAFNRPVEFEGFYGIKDMHENLESRNMEGKWKRQNILSRRHWSFKEQQAIIYNPKWVNILDPKNQLITEPIYFKQCFNWFMKQFEDKPPLLPLESKEWKIGNDFNELQGHLFMLDVDWTTNFTQPPSNWIHRDEKDTMDWEELEEEINRFVPVEPKLNRLVFRTKLVQAVDDEDCNAPLEVFKPTYLFDKEFLDKKDLHKALEIKVKKRFELQYQNQKEVRDDKRRRCERKVAKYARKAEALYSKYRNEELKKRKRKTKSHDDLLRLSKDIEPLDELNVDFLEARVVGFLPWTDDIIDLPQTRTKIMFRHDFKYAFDTPYQKQVPPYLEIFEHGYLDVEVKKYQKQHGIETIDPNAEDQEDSDHDAPIQGNFVMNASELQNQAKANQIQKVTLVAPYYQKKWEQALKAEDDTLMLKWIESGLGSEQYKQLFETFEDLSIKMGPRKKIRLFEDMRNYEDDAPVFKKARSRPGSNYANWKEQRNRLISPPPSNNVKLKLEYLSKQEQMNRTVTDRRAQNTMGGQTDDIIVRLPPAEHIQQIVAQNTTEVIPEYYPLHILNEDIIYLQVATDTVAHSVNPQFKQENTNISQLLKQIAPASAAAATLNSSKKVLGYVDKQVRKELIDTCKEADLHLLRGYMDQFGECLFRRTDQINARSYKNEGVTVLQHALLMDYEKKELLINLEDYYGQRDLSPRNDPNKDDSEDAEDCEEHAAFRSRRRQKSSSSVSAMFGGPKEKPLLDTKYIKKAMAKESEASSKIKQEVVAILCQKAGANPFIKNCHDLNAVQIATLYCKNGLKLTKIISGPSFMSGMGKLVEIVKQSPAPRKNPFKTETPKK